MSVPPRAAVSLAIALSFLGGVAVAPAGAATVSSSGGVITFQAAPGEANSAAVDSFDGTELTLSDIQATVTNGGGCSTSEYVANTVFCPAGSVTRIRFLLGDRDDSVLVHSGVGVSRVTEIDAGPGAGGLQSITSESPGRTIVTGGAGTDMITTYGGDDQLVGGGGDDTIRSGTGHDEVHGGAGADDLRTGPGADVVDGGDGDDLIYGDQGMDDVYGGGGNDRLYGEQDADRLFGGDGDDWLLGDGSFEQGFASGDELNGGPGRDLADYGSRGGTLPVTITLDEQRNDGAAGENDNVGPLGDIEIVEGSGNDDTLIGSGRPDELRGGYGNDDLDGRGGDDLLDGFAGNDRLAGGDGNDTLDGSADNDGLLGEGGDDQLLGGTGDDTIGGGPGADLLDGGLDSDSMLARDAVVDQIRCSLGNDVADVDAIDTFVDRAQCEQVSSTAAGGGTTTTTLPPSPGTTTTTTFTLAPLVVPKLGLVLKQGIPVTLTLRVPARIRAELLLARAVARRFGLTAAAAPYVLGRTTTGLRRAGRTTVRVRLSRSGKRRLRKLRGRRRVSATLRVTTTTVDGTRTTTSRRVTLRR